MQEKDVERVVNSDTWIYEDKAFIEWLRGIKKYGYARKCKKDMIDYLEWCIKKGIISQPRATELLEKHKELIKSEDTEHFIADSLPRFVKDYYEAYKDEMKESTAIGKTKALRGFFTFYRKPLIIRKGALDVEEEITSDIKFTQSILAKMCSVVDIEGKAKIMAGKDLGLRIGDFRKMLRKPIIAQIQLAHAKQIEYPLEFEVKTEKEGVVAVGHLMYETVEALKRYWETSLESKYVFPNTDPKKPCTPRTLNYLLKTAFAKAFPEITEHAQIRFHALRDFKISALANANVNKWAIKRMVGKKISKDMADYVKGLDLKGLFRQAEHNLTLSGLTNMNHSRLDVVEKRMANMESALMIIGEYVAKALEEKGLTVMAKNLKQAVKVMEPKEKPETTLKIWRKDTTHSKRESASH